LWYFDDLDFLWHNEIQVAGKSTMEDEPEQEDMFLLWHLQRDCSLCTLIMSCMDTVSCCAKRCCANLFDCVWGP
jgi:hypothetical protein